MSKIFKKPKIAQPRTVATTPVETPEQARIRESTEEKKAQRGMLRKYGGQGRTSTVLSGKSNLG